MRRDSLFGLGLLILVIILFLSSKTPCSVVLDNDPTRIENQILRATNAVRLNYGLAPLSVDPALAHVSRARAEDMVTRGYFSHYDPQTGSVAANPLLEAEGFFERDRDWEGAEVYAGGHLRGLTPYLCDSTSLISSPKEMADFLVQSWMNSPNHRMAVLNPDFTHVGVGFSLSREHMRVGAVQIFGE